MWQALRQGVRHQTTHVHPHRREAIQGKRQNSIIARCAQWKKNEDENHAERVTFIWREGLEFALRVK